MQVLQMQDGGEMSKAVQGGVPPGGGAGNPSGVLPSRACWELPGGLALSSYPQAETIAETL